MQGAGPELYATLPLVLPGIEVDAAPNRQLNHAPEIVRARVATEPRPNVLVVHLGTNGIFADTTFDELMAAALHIPAVVVVSIKAPRDWETEVNARLTKGVSRHLQQASLVDWWALATARPDHLRPDGFHISRSGAVAYAEAIAAGVRGVARPHG
jgi:lysophospholipase L1-like esterase